MGVIGSPCASGANHASAAGAPIVAAIARLTNNVLTSRRRVRPDMASLLTGKGGGAQGGAQLDGTAVVHAARPCGG